MTKKCWESSTKILNECSMELMDRLEEAMHSEHIIEEVDNH